MNADYVQYDGSARRVMKMKVYQERVGVMVAVGYVLQFLCRCFEAVIVAVLLE